MQEREFRVSIGFRIFYGIALLGVLVFLAGMGLLASGPGKNTTASLLFISALGLPILMILLNVFRSRVTISQDRITRTTAFGTKTLLCADVKGYRSGQKFIVIEPVDGSSSPRIKINNLVDFGDSEELTTWVTQNFTNLDAADLKAEEAKVLQNSTYGATGEERQATVKKYKTRAVIYNFGGALVLVGLIIAGENFAATLLAIAYPLLGVVLILTSDGLIKFVSSGKVSVNSFVVIGMVLPIATTLFKSLADYQIYSYDHAWLPWLLIGAALFAMLCAWGINKVLSSIKGQVVAMAVVSCVYGFGSTIQVNCMFDKSAPQEYKTTIGDKKIYKGKSTTYKLTLSPWRAGNESKDIEVGRHRFNSVQIGDTLSVSTREGLLHIPWFYLTN